MNILGISVIMLGIILAQGISKADIQRRGEPQWGATRTAMGSDTAQHRKSPIPNSKSVNG